MKNYDERTRYILEQRNIRIEKRRNIRGTITAAAGMAGALTLVVGTTVAMSGIAGRDGLSSAVAQSGQLAAETESGNVTEDGLYIHDTMIQIDVTEPKLNLPDERIYKLSKDETATTLNFEMEDFPNSIFTLDKNRTVFSVNGAEIFRGMPINSLYIADLNGDGYREIVADTCWGSGSDVSRIFAYDYKNDALYQLADRFNYNYYTTFYNNEVGYEYRAYGSTCGVPDGSGELTLDIMTKISENTPDLYAMRNVIGGGWDEITTTPSTLIYSHPADGAEITVLFRMNGEPSQITDNDTAAAGYSAVYKTEWLETKDKDGNTIAEFTINDMPIRVTFNRQAKEKLGDVIGLAIKAFRQSTVRYDNNMSDAEILQERIETLEGYIKQAEENISSFEVQKSDYQKKIEQLDKNSSGYSSAKALLESKIEEVNEVIGRLKSMISHNKEQINALNSKISSLQ